MEMVNVMLAIGMASRLMELVERAMRARRDISEKEMDDAFGRAREANTKWKDAIAEKEADGGLGPATKDTE